MSHSFRLVEQPSLTIRQGWFVAANFLFCQQVNGLVFPAAYQNTLGEYMMSRHR